MAYKCIPFILNRIILYFILKYAYLVFIVNSKLLLSGNNNVYLTCIENQKLNIHHATYSMTGPQKHVIFTLSEIDAKHVLCASYIQTIQL